MAIEGVDVKGQSKSALERGRNMGDPSRDDAEADADRDRLAGRRVRAGSQGKGVTPIEGTSASNLDVPPGSRTCGNTFTGYGQCGGRIDEETGRCTKCQIPTRAEFETAMPMLHTEMGTPNGLIEAISDGTGAIVESRLPAHEKEAMRHIIRREVASDEQLACGWDPDALGQYSTTPPHLKNKAAEFQRRVDAECLRRFRLAGLEPRRAD